jgi:hypothetical protein
MHLEQQDQCSNPSLISRHKLFCFNMFQSTNHQPRVNHTIYPTQQVFHLTGQGFKPSYFLGLNKSP